MSGPTSLPLKSASKQSWLLAISLTRWNYALSIIADATVALVMLCWAAVTLQHPRALVPVAVFALLGYTLMEYFWHRFLFHWRHAPRSAREGHGRHHRAPDALLALPFFTAIPHAILVWGLAAAAVGTSLGAFFTGVWFLGYVSYSGLHHLVHAEAVQHPAMQWLRDVHHVHHARPNRNFGVTTPFWDVVFGTWSPPKRG